MATGDKRVKVDALKAVYNHVNGEMDDLKSALSCTGIIDVNLKRDTTTAGNVTIEWDEDVAAYHIYGRCTSSSSFSVYNDSVLPAGMIPDGDYSICMEFVRGKSYHSDVYLNAVIGSSKTPSYGTPVPLHIDSDYSAPVKFQIVAVPNIDIDTYVRIRVEKQYSILQYKAKDFDWHKGFIGQAAQGCIDESSPNFWYSDFVRLPLNRYIERVGVLSNTGISSVYQIAFYDKDYAFLTGRRSESIVTVPANVVIPTGAVYYRVTCKDEYKETCEITFYLNQHGMDVFAAGVLDKINTVRITAPIDWIAGIALENDGTEVEAANYSSTDLIELPDERAQNAEIRCWTWDGNTYASAVFYDSTGNVVGYIKTSAPNRYLPVTIPTTAKFVRLCVGQSNIDKVDFRIKADRIDYQSSILHDTRQRLNTVKDWEETNEPVIEDLTEWMANSEKAMNLLPDFDLTGYNGVSFTKVEKGRFHVKGTVTNFSNYNIAGSTTTLPSGLKKGGRYYLRYFTNFESIAAKVLTYKGGAESVIINTSKSTEFDVPNDIDGLIVRITVNHVTPPLKGSWFEIALFDTAKDCSEAREYKPLPPPMFTIIDDDGRVKFKTWMLPIIKDLHVPITSAVVTLWAETREWTDRYTQAQQDYANGKITSDELAAIKAVYDSCYAKVDETEPPYIHDDAWGQRYMNWNEIRECQEAGAEIVSHTYAHREGNPSFSEQLMQHEYQMSKNMLMAHGVYTESLVFSKGSGWLPINRRAGARAFKYGFDCPNSDGTIGHHNNFVGDDPHRIHRWNFSTDFFTKSESEIFADLDALMNSRTGWMVWMMHTSDAGFGQEKADVIRHTLEHAIEIGLPVVTTYDGAKEYFGTAYPQLDVFP